MIVSQYRRTGYVFNDDRASGGQVTEQDIVCCTHCQATLKRTEWEIEGGWCGNCNSHICIQCAVKMDTEGCVPFVKLVDEALNKQAKDRAYRQALGLEG